jgi:transcriptional regulator with XRE-family HTH domain
MRFTEIIKELCKQKGISERKLALDNGLNAGAVYNWVRSNEMPKGETIAKLADYFGVTTDYILGREGKQEISESQLKFALFGDADIDDDVLDDIKAIAKVHAQRKKNRTE